MLCQVDSYRVDSVYLPAVGSGIFQRPHVLPAVWKILPVAGFEPSHSRLNCCSFA